MKDILTELSKHPVKTRIQLTGTLIVARDIAHAKLKERLDNGEGLPDYLKNHPVYYAGPAKTPEVCTTLVHCHLFHWAAKNINQPIQMKTFNVFQASILDILCSDFFKSC